MTSKANEFERRALGLVEKALEQPTDKRREFLLAQTQQDLKMRERVFSIIDAESGRAPLLPTGGAIEHATDRPAPEIIGAYRIEREIGSGGMGSVYLGRRMTEDFDHVAAIKVVRADVASPRLIERLRAERRTLARLKHPNIAQMYDGGETEDGAPYLAMEFVAGAPLDQFLQSNDVSLSERLRLFRDVCDGVAYAHRNLIIHRDLSPRNMLVSDDGRVKLIDFGIAHSLDDDTPAGRFALPQMTMTKGYAAPERMDGEPASTITDIYSLGVIFEEIIGEPDAPRRADLRAIAGKACATAPEERYQSVDALVGDIAAYQRGEAVAAANGGWSYALARFAGRRKIAVGAAALGFVAVIATSIIMSVLFLRADASERRAVARFEEVRELAGFIMFDFHDEVAKLEGSTLAREKLVNTALGYLDALNATPGASDALKLEIASGYKRLSDVTGNPSYANLGRRKEADALLERAVAQITELHQAAPEAPAVLSAYVEIKLAQALQEGFSNNDFERGIAILGEARSAFVALSSRTEPSIKDRLNEANTDLTHGYYLFSLGRLDESIVQTETALEKYESLAVAKSENSDARLGVARASINMAEANSWQIYYAEGDYEPILPLFDRGVEETRKLLAKANPTLAFKTHFIIALLKRANTTCYIEGRENQGLADLKEATEFAKNMIAGDPKNDHLNEQLTHIILQSSECYQNIGNSAAAVRAGMTAVARREARVKSNPDNPGLLKELANTLSVLAYLHIAADDWAGACASAQRNVEIWRQYASRQSALNEFNRQEQEGIAETLAECDKRGFS